MKKTKQYKGIDVTDREWEIIHLWPKYYNVEQLAMVLKTTTFSIVCTITKLEKKGILFKNKTVVIADKTGVYFGSKREPYYVREDSIRKALDGFRFISPEWSPSERAIVNERAYISGEPLRGW